MCITMWATDEDTILDNNGHVLRHLRVDGVLLATCPQ